MQKNMPMALINCPECGHQMSDTAKQCTNCGYKINGSHARLSKCIYAFLLFVSIVILSFAIGLIMNYSLDPICHGDDNFVIGLCVSLIAAIVVLAGC